MEAHAEELEQRLIEVAREAGATEERLRARVADLEEQLAAAARVRGVAEHELLVRLRDLEEERDHWKNQSLMITGSRGYRVLEAARRGGLWRLSRRSP